MVAATPLPALLLEHVNLEIPSAEIGRAFYVRALGGAENPVSTSERQLHVNVGVSQFHLLLKRSVAKMEPVVHAQVWAGHIELWTIEPLRDILSRIEIERSAVLAMCPTSQLSAAESEGGAALEVVCPWGNRFVVREAPAGYLPRLSGWRGHAGGHASLVGMPGMTHLVRPGAAAMLHAFWSEVVCCAASLETVCGGGGGAAGGGGGGVCVVPFECGQALRFEESGDAPAADRYDREDAAAYHLALYLPADTFERAFRAAEAAGVLFENPRFRGGPPQFASAMTWEGEAGARQCGQFRVKDLRPGSAAAPPLVLELEIRSPTHVSCPLAEARGSV